MMSKYLRDVPLKKWNTLGVTSTAEKLIYVESERDLVDYFSQENPLVFKVLGGGSNILITTDIMELVFKIAIKGINILKEDDETITLEVAAGEVWHDFVMYAVAHKYAGVENLSLIPGTVGASPIQNIGAYGVEVKDVITRIRYFDIASRSIQHIDAADCKFGYRDSIFKHELKDKCIITSVTFVLNKHAKLNTSYGHIMDELKGIAQPPYSIADVSQAVINIRSSKLPNPNEIGNCGSFFKNPIVPTTIYEAISKIFDRVPSFHSSEGIKIPAAWLIEQCGWKGFREGDVGVHKQQALVLVNYGDALGQDILALSERIIHSVYKQFGIQLEREVQVW